MRRAGKATLYDKNKNILQLFSGPDAISQCSYFVQVLSVSLVTAVGRQ